ncbi:MAG: D-cysteine desulfhydrase family protein [bacterium]|nr:D-cysteine desulfhydrase family protein [bacterium]
MNLDDVPRMKFAHLPTPIEPMTALRESFGGPNLFVKRDDCTGLAGGGNKTRKLEYLMADAMAKKADTIITLGGIQSNHVRQTAAISAKLGFQCHVAVSNPINTDDQQYLTNGNVLLDHLLGAVVHRVPPEEETDKLVSRLEEDLKASGKNPYVIPIGGSNVLGSLGYVTCAREILAQAEEKKIDFDWIILPIASAGTLAGLAAGLRLTSAKTRVLGISAWKLQDELQDTLFELVEGVCDYLGHPCDLSPGDPSININYNFIGKGYGLPTKKGLSAIKRVATTEGILLDPVYTGKAMAGLISLIEENFFQPTDNVLFLHTGGSQGLYGYVNFLLPLFR